MIDLCSPSPDQDPRPSRAMADSKGSGSLSPGRKNRESSDKKDKKHKKDKEDKKEAGKKRSVDGLEKRIQDLEMSLEKRVGLSSMLMGQLQAIYAASGRVQIVGSNASASSGGSASSQASAPAQAVPDMVPLVAPPPVAAILPAAEPVAKWTPPAPPPPPQQGWTEADDEGWRKCKGATDCYNTAPKNGDFCKACRSKWLEAKAH